MSYKHERLDSMVGDDLRRRAIHEEKVGLENIWAELEATIETLSVTATALVRIQAALDVSNVLKIEELMRAEDPLGWMHNVGDVMQVYATYRCNIRKYYQLGETKWEEGGNICDDWDSNTQEREEAV